MIFSEKVTILKFYTFADTKSGKFFHRYYEDGERKIEVHNEYPLELFTKSTSKKYESNQKSLHGKPLQRLKFNSIEEAKEFTKNHENIDGDNGIHGQTNYINQFISSQYPGEILFDSSNFRICYIDIEVDVDGTGFPSPDKAEHRVTAITMKMNSGQTFTFGYEEYSKPAVFFVKCSNEKDLLNNFINTWDELKPDILSGWNIAGFDIPYLVNRITKVLGQKACNRLSPFHESNTRNLIEECDIQNNQKSYRIFGLTIYDYMEVYKKFSVTTLESYSLNFVAHYELGEKKIDYSDVGSLDNLMKEDYTRFVDYNIHDAVLVERLENKLRFINIAITVSFLAKSRFGDVFSALRLWDSLIYNRLLEKNIQIPPSKHHAESSIEGGYVKEPQIGLHSWVVTFDLTSLYPSIIMGANMSPETLTQSATGNYIQNIIDGDFSELEKTSGDCSIANGAKFTLSRHGIMPEITRDMFNLRKTHKKKMLTVRQVMEDIKNDGDKVDEYEDLKNQEAASNAMQMAVKILMNSLKMYGACNREVA